MAQQPRPEDRKQDALVVVILGILIGCLVLFGIWMFLKQERQPAKKNPSQGMNLHRRELVIAAGGERLDGVLHPVGDIARGVLIR